MLKALVKYHHKRVCQKLLTHPQVFLIIGDPIIQPSQYSLSKIRTLSPVTVSPLRHADYKHLHYYVKGIVKMEVYPGSIFSQYQQET